LRTYVYHKSYHRFTILLIDRIGFLCKGIISFFGGTLADRKIKKVLVFKLDHIGDVFLATPALKSLKQKFPSAEVTMVVGSWAREVVEGNPWIDKIISYDAYWNNRRKRKKLNILETILLTNSLRREGYEIFFDLRGDFGAIVMGFLSGAPRRVGFGHAGGGFLLTDEISVTPGKHQTEILLDAIRVVGGNLVYSYPEIFLSETEKKFANEFLLAHSVNSTDILVGIHMGGGYRSKVWNPKRFAELINRISEKGLRVLLIGGKEDLEIFGSMRQDIEDSLINAIGITTIKETAALIERSDLFIGNDSFAVQMAAAMGVPTIVIFSAVNDPKRWGPKGDQVKIITREVPCKGCQKRECSSGECMELITVREVLEQIQNIISMQSFTSPRDWKCIL
jgi:heptosyltransferase-2